MTAIQVRSGLRLQEVVEILERQVSPRSYWLHNAIGNADWSLILDNGGGIRGSGFPMTVEVQDPALATLVSLLVS